MSNPKIVYGYKITRPQFLQIIETHVHIYSNIIFPVDNYFIVGVSLKSVSNFIESTTLPLNLIISYLQASLNSNFLINLVLDSLTDIKPDLYFIYP